MVLNPTVGSQEHSGKERNACLKGLSHSSLSDKLHLGRGRWFSTPCLLLEAEAVPLTVGEFRTLQWRFRIHLSISIPSIRSVFYPRTLLNCLYVDQKSDLLPPSDLRMTINSLENHSCFSQIFIWAFKGECNNERICAVLHKLRVCQGFRYTVRLNCNLWDGSNDLYLVCEYMPGVCVVCT